MRSLLVCLILLSAAPSVTSQEKSEPVPSTPPAAAEVEAVLIGDGPYRFSVDTSQAPDLTPWVKEKLIPVLKDWYPNLQRGL
jgi:hypothetical protein